MAPTTSGPSDTSRIDNPFHHMEEIRVDGLAKYIVDTYGLKKYEDTVLKAARILVDPQAWRDIKVEDTGELTLAEREDLERDEIEARDHDGKKPFWMPSFWRSGTKSTPEEPVKHRPSGFWQTPKELRTTIITMCIAAVVQGWSQTNNGANLTWLVGTGLSDNNPDQSCDPHGRVAWIFAIVNAAPWFSAAIFALLVSDPANELLFGRRAAIGMSALFILGGSIGGSLSRTWWSFLICRIILGLGMGCKASVVAVFVAEVAPARMRGSLIVNWQLFDAFGIFLSFSSNLMVSPLGADSWRWMTATPAFPTIILLALVLVACPESPRFLMSRSHYLEAYETLTRLRGSRIIAAKELVYTHYQLSVERGQGISHPRRSSRASLDSEAGGQQLINQPKPTFLQKLWQLVSIRRNRNALITAVICMLSQQMCGVNVLIFYSATIFANAVGAVCTNVTPESLLAPLLMSWGIGLTNFMFSFPAYWLIDRKGRKWLLMTTVPFLFLFMGAAALTYVNGSHKVLLCVFTYLFLAFYSVGMGPVPFSISAEVFPLDHRVVGMSFAVFVNFFGAGLLTLFIPAITDSPLGHGGLLGIFAFLNVVSFVLISCLVRETVGAADADNPSSMTALALEELYKIFDLPTSTVFKHQTRSLWHSMWWRKGKEAPQEPEPLYKLWERNRKQYLDGIELKEQQKPKRDVDEERIEG